MATSLPLPRGFFDANVRLSEEQRRQYIEYAESSIRKIFALSDSHKNSWIPSREKKGIAVFRNFGQLRGATAYKSNIAEVACKSELRASLEQIGRAYAAHDDALFRRLMKKLNPNVMDAAVILTIVPRTPRTPFRYIGIKWYAVKTPTPLVSHRDYCCLEVQDKIVDAYGNEMFIRILNSIDVNECPSLENSHGLVRAKILAGFIYRTDRSEPNLIRVHHLARLDPSGYFPSQWAFKTAEAQLVSSVVQTRRIVEKQQMNACTFVDKKQWVPNHERQHCAVCSRAFGTFRPRHHCRCCGEVICGKCSVIKSVHVPGTSLKSVRICSICNMGVQRATTRTNNNEGEIENDVDDDSMSDISSSSITSSSTVGQNEMNMMDLYMSANNPGTPSAYSSASTQSNLSIRSTASSRSVYDARSRGQSGLFRGHYGPSRTPRSHYNDGNTPRSYIANNLTSSHGAVGFGGNVTPRSEDTSGADTPSSSAASQRMSAFKHNPLDLGYLGNSINGSHDRTESAASLLPPTDTQQVDTADALETENTTETETEPVETVIQQNDRKILSSPDTEEKENDQDYAQPQQTAPCASESPRSSRSSTIRPSLKDELSSGKKSFLGSLFSRGRGLSVGNLSARAAS